MELQFNNQKANAKIRVRQRNAGLRRKSRRIKNDIIVVGGPDSRVSPKSQ